MRSLQISMWSVRYRLCQVHNSTKFDCLIFEMSFIKLLKPGLNTCAFHATWLYYLITITSALIFYLVIYIMFALKKLHNILKTADQQATELSARPSMINSLHRAKLFYNYISESCYWHGRNSCQIFRFTPH